MALADGVGLLLGPEGRVLIRRGWGPAAYTYLWVPPPLSGSQTVWPFFLSSVLNHLSPTSALLGFNPSHHLFGVFVPLPLPASFCLCGSFHQLLMFFPFRISPHLILLLLSPPFSPRVFFSSPPMHHCLSGIPLYPSRAGRSR